MQRLVRVKGVLMSQWDLIMLLKMHLLHWMDRLVTIISICFYLNNETLFSVSIEGCWWA